MVVQKEKVKDLEQYILKICDSLGYDLEHMGIDLLLALSNNRDVKINILGCFNDEDKCIDSSDLLIEDSYVQKVVKFCLKKYGYTIVDFSTIALDETDTLEFDFSYICDKFPSIYQLLINDISRRPLLTPNEEKDLFLEYKNTHNDVIRDFILESNLRLVISIAKCYLASGVEFLDLIQSGSEGLSKAFDRFDIDKGYKFSTYATWWIRQAIILSIKNESRIIRIPIDVHNSLNKLKRVEEKLCNKLFREPTDQEIANELNISIEKVIYLKQIRCETLSLDQPLEKRDEDNYDNTLMGTISDGLNLSDIVVDNNIVVNALNTPTLTEKERDVIIKYYFYDMKLERIGAEYNTSRQRIFQIRDKALEKMRKYNDLY